jgi:predicted amidohydrolase YtcJ
LSNPYRHCFKTYLSEAAIDVKAVNPGNDGSLEVGKLADFVVLEDDPRRVEATAISDIKVSETWMNGTQVYSA